jgi:hypothetical protein
MARQLTPALTSSSARARTSAVTTATISNDVAGFDGGDGTAVDVMELVGVRFFQQATTRVSSVVAM